MAADLKKLTDSLMRNYVGFNGGALVVIYDAPTTEIANSIVDSAHSLVNKGMSDIIFNIDDWRKGKPLTSFSNDLKENIDLMYASDTDNFTLLYIMHCLPGEETMRGQLVKFGQEKGKIGGLPNCTIDVLAAAYDPMNKPEFSQELHEFIMQEKEKLVNSNGVLMKGLYGNPIPAEVFAHPVNAEGRLVVSGSYAPLMALDRFKDDFKTLTVALERTPITWRIKEGKIIGVSCDDDEIQKYVRKQVFETDYNNGMIIGEFGLPANLAILSSAITGNLLLDEKGRVHIAHGHGYPKRTGAGYETDVHGDGLVANATLYSTRLNQKFMENNVYSSEIFTTLN
jgi:hypothetical protein